MILRWLHCSDFHQGKDRTAQERLLEKVIEHVQDQVSKGFVPDLVFITGDLADKGLKAQYTSLRSDFINPLPAALGGSAWPGRILAVPGNHDVDRTKADGFDRAAPLAPRAEFFDASKTGKAKRDIVAPRFRAYGREAPIDVPGG